jgi:hypothetical protein
MAVEPGVELLLDCRNGASILRALRVGRVPELPLRRRQATDLALDGNDRRGNDLVVTLLDESGTAFDSFVLSPKGTRYADWASSASGRISGGPRHVRPDEMDLRCVRLPLPDRTHWIQCSGAQASNVEGVASLERVPPNLYSIHGVSVGPASPAVSLGLPAAAPQLIPWATEADRGPASAVPTPPPLFPGIEENFRTPDGEITSIETRVSNGDSRERFDIVITGDGFLRGEAKKFDRLATRLIDGLSKMQPFRSVRQLINWHVVQVASKDSGVEHCPTNKPRDTFYQTEGCWDGTSVNSYLGTGESGLRRIWWAAEKALQNDAPDLIIVVANCRWYGGHGYPGAKLVIVPSCDSRPRLFVPMVAHECGHAILGLADEYLGGGLEDPSRPDPNKAHLADVSASVRQRLLERMPNTVQPVRGPTPEALDHVWWKDLARKHELNKGGIFRAVHVPGDPRAGRYDPRPQLTHTSHRRFLGAFWGCQDRSDVNDLVRAYCDLVGTPNSGSAVFDAVRHELEFTRNVGESEATWWDPKAAGYFRSMAVCRMRQVTYGFCRVCEHLLRNAIKEVCGEPPAPPFPPRN